VVGVPVPVVVAVVPLTGVLTGDAWAQIPLSAIESFLTTVFGVNDSKSFMPLRQLSYALHDLNRGKVVPLLTPQKRSNRPPDSISKAAFMAIAAACMELFVESGVTRNAAASRVAGNLHTQFSAERPYARDL
jgi:hypothetical protein